MLAFDRFSYHGRPRLVSSRSSETKDLGACVWTLVAVADPFSCFLSAHKSLGWRELPGFERGGNAEAELAGGFDVPFGLACRAFASSGFARCGR